MNIFPKVILGVHGFHFSLVYLFKSWEEDVNLDGKFDNLHFNIQVPLSDSEAIYSVQLLLTFDYQLHVSDIYLIVQRVESESLVFSSVFCRGSLSVSIKSK